ncbi:MAG: Hsp20 family protein [Alphaproteobacteria bacterium]|nr:Hsp20 family protein [Alphaproteobacteria bacterium]
MSRLSYFNSPFLLGFEQLERTLDRVAKASTEGYPPYNIEQLGSDRLRITLAVAGFGAHELEITVEENQLVIRGRQDEAADERIFLHRGIAARQFQRSFLLAEGIEVVGADLRDGLLNVDLIRPQPASKVQKIDIATGGVSEKPKFATVESKSKRAS